MQSSPSQTFNNLPAEATELLKDPTVIATLKQSFLAKHKQWQQLLKTQQKKLQQISQLQLPDFDKWFYTEIVKSELKQPLTELTQAMHNLRFNLIRTNQQYKQEKQSAENWQAKVDQALNFPLQELLSQFLTLKRSSNRFVTCCPFHQEKTPSFTLYPESNTAHCFGCSWHGNSLKFLMDYSNLSFAAAVKTLSP